MANTQKNSIFNIHQALAVVKRGGIIVHATETCYGFACDIFNKKALKRLYHLKKMNFKKPVSIQVSDLKMAKHFGVFTKKAQVLAKKYWQGPLTIIVKRKKTLPTFLNPGIKTVGIRLPNHQLSRRLVKKFGTPLVTTSANISGKPSPYSVPEIKKQFMREKLQPDFIINSGRLSKNPPSTIIEVSGKTLRVIRQGSLFLS